MTKKMTRSRKSASVERRMEASLAKAAALRQDTAAPLITAESLANQYAYVVSDLIRVGVLAAVLIGGLIALSFFLK
jgi:hypothetical protein